MKYFEFQRLVMKHVIEEKEKELISENEKYLQEKEKTDKIYEYVA